MKTLTFFALFVIAGAARAETEVIYFGGHAASPEQMKCWEQGARRDTTFGSDFSFKGIPYPAGARRFGKPWSYDAAVTAGAGTIKATVLRIKKELEQNPGKRFVIVGHSSGAALSNQVVAAVAAAGPLHAGRIEMVNLDGFAPPKSLQKKVKSTCWFGQNGRGLRSLNAGSMLNNCTQAKAVTSASCRTRMCLHFALVNKTAPLSLGRDYPSNGYNGCRTNLAWLTQPAGGTNLIASTPLVPARPASAPAASR